MTVNFYTFSKRQNSTARPTGAAAESFDCKLKDSSGVLRPTLEVYKTAAWNPTALNYAYIAAYSRYYYVSDWQWITGRWECTLEVDVLASWKTQVGAASKFVLRSAYEQNPDVIDTYYPSTAGFPIVNELTHDFSFIQNFGGGAYVLGVANRSGSGAGAITYYTMGAGDVRQLVQYMLIQASDLWTTGFTGFTDTLYRAIYSPFDYIKSCKYFPYAFYSFNTELVSFGNYESSVYGGILDPNATNWPTSSFTFTLPSGWSTMEAKYRTSPACHMYLVFNPWGVIELNPLDFANMTGVKVKISPDFISGDCLLEVFAIGGLNDRFVTQRNAKIAVDINLSSSSVDIGGALTGILGLAGGIAVAATGGTAAIAGGVLAATGGAASAAESMVPSASGSVGQQSGGLRAMTGICKLIISRNQFPVSSPSEVGYPLMSERILSTIPGYIKCADGDISCAGYNEELSRINELLTGGFFYE